MLPFSPIDLRKVAIAAVVLLLFAIASVKVHSWWAGREAVFTEEIARRDHAIALRDLQIAVRDKQLAALRHQDSVIVRTVAVRAAELAATKTNLADAKRAIDAEAATHEGVVPIAVVHLVEAKADTAIASCERLGASKDTRINNLLAQLEKQDTTRAQLDSTRVQQDSTRKDIVALLRPPWYKRALGWVDDHVVTLLIGAAGGFVLAKR